MTVVDKKIADWLGVSLPTYYRWRRAGLLKGRPDSAVAAMEMRARIDAGKDAAYFDRPNGSRGRTSLKAVARAIRGKS